MGKKIFVSYKYGDTKVKSLNIYENTLWGRQLVATKVRHYVDKLANLLESENNIYKGEDDGQSLADFSDQYIGSALRDKIYDSSITIVLVSKGMKDLWANEKDQWIPWEISYSLSEYVRNGRTSLSNGVIAVVLPDEVGSYEYYITHDSVCDCTSFNTPFLFKILRENMFNQKSPLTSECANSTTIYYGDSSYIQTVKWENFEDNPNHYLNKAIELRDKKEQYNIKKRLD